MKNLKRNIVSAILIVAMAISPFLVVKNVFARSLSEAEAICDSLPSLGSTKSGNTLKCHMSEAASSKCSAAGGTFTGKGSGNWFDCYIPFEASSSPTNPGTDPTDPGSGSTNPGSGSTNPGSGSSGSGSTGTNPNYDGGAKAAILTNCANQNDGSGGGIICVFKLVVNILSVLIGIAGVIGIVYVGIQYLTAGGNEEQVRKAKRRLIEIVIGLAVYAAGWALLSWLLPDAETSLEKGGTIYTSIISSTGV